MKCIYIKFFLLLVVDNWVRFMLCIWNVFILYVNKCKVVIKENLLFKFLVIMIRNYMI